MSNVKTTQTPGEDKQAAQTELVAPKTTAKAVSKDEANAAKAKLEEAWALGRENIKLATMEMAARRAEIQEAQQGHDRALAQVQVEAAAARDARHRQELDLARLDDVQATPADVQAESTDEPGPISRLTGLVELRAVVRHRRLLRRVRIARVDADLPEYPAVGVRAAFHERLLLGREAAHLHPGCTLVVGSVDRSALDEPRRGQP